MIEVVSDVVCPWCFVGKRRLAKAIAAAGIPLAVRWRPYQLDPTIPPEGKPRRVYLEQKFGSAERIGQLHETVKAAGASEGLALALEKIEVSPNTLDAHRLVRWAGEDGVQDAVVEALFRGYFTEGRDIGSRPVLAGIAAEAGMDGEAVAARLATDADLDAVRAEIDTARRVGVTGVPTFILAGRYGLVGAQPAEHIAAAIKEIAAGAPPARAMGG